MKSKYTKELLEPIVKKSYSMSQVLRELDLATGGGTHVMIRNRIKYYNIDISHFTGQGWSRGKTKHTSEIIRKQVETRKIPDDKIFKKNGYPIARVHIRKKLLDMGWEEKCNICGIKTWLDKHISMHLDHINGDPMDNRKENLRFLCPNCHQQTDTWGNKRLKTRTNTHKCKNKINKPKIHIYCKDCNKQISKKAIRCKSCAGKLQKRKCENRPTKEVLLNDIKMLGYCGAGKKYGVSDNAIRKWLK